MLPRPTPNGLMPPSESTMAKYGLSFASWWALAERQGFVCAICKKLPSSCRLNIDHVHVNGWAKMDPGARALWVRGLLCYWDNSHTCGRGVTLFRAENMVAYLKQPLPFNVATNTREEA